MVEMKRNKCREIQIESGFVQSRSQAALDPKMADSFRHGHQPCLCNSRSNCVDFTPAAEYLPVSLFHLLHHLHDWPKYSFICVAIVFFFPRIRYTRQKSQYCIIWHFCQCPCILYVSGLSMYTIVYISLFLLSLTDQICTISSWPLVASHPLMRAS